MITARRPDDNSNDNHAPDTYSEVWSAFDDWYEAAQSYELTQVDSIAQAVASADMRLQLAIKALMNSAVAVVKAKAHRAGETLTTATMYERAIHEAIQFDQMRQRNRTRKAVTMPRSIVIHGEPGMDEAYDAMVDDGLGD